MTELSTLEELTRALARRGHGITIAGDGSSHYVHRWGIHRFKSLPELSQFVAEVNGLAPKSPTSPTSQTSPTPNPS